MRAPCRLRRVRPAAWAARRLRRAYGACALDAAWTLRALAASCALACALSGGCATTTRPAAEDAAAAHDGEAALPAWLHAPGGLVRAPELEEAAALLCARDTDGVIDDDARRAAKIVDGQVLGLLRKGPTAADAEAALARDAGPLLVEKRMTHAGAVVGTTPSGEACAALVGARRLLTVTRAPPATTPPGTPLDLSLAIPAHETAVLYLMKPDGFVERQPLPAAEGTQRASVPPKEQGRYVLEIVVDRDAGPSDPEVALLWPVIVGAAKDPPFPEVLFPDKGHDDLALSHRAEALVQRLRDEELIEPFKVAPALVEVAKDRALAVAARGVLGHRLPSTGDAAEELRARFGDEPRAQFLKLAEVQAQGSTLADAWQALLDSPAHRYFLVDTSFTHAGVAVARGKDAAGRATITMVALLGRRPPSRDVEETRATILEVANDARDKRGEGALAQSKSLNAVATRLAQAMLDNRRVDETLLGEPVAQIAVENDASLSQVKTLVARTDDPLLLLSKGIPPLLLDIDAQKTGIGMALDPREGVFYVVILAGD